ncbi:MAG: hypothetical protein M3297_06710 [Thermoproteota archaeon]|nr:hypothetical protein [Thermoproteota archaeon]
MKPHEEEITRHQGTRVFHGRIMVVGPVMAGPEGFVLNSDGTGRRLAD